MLRTLSSAKQDPSWLGSYAKDFHKRFLNLLGYQFRAFGSVQALAIDESANIGISLLPDSEKVAALESVELDKLFTPFDLKRLDSYANNMLDYHVILDLMPTIADLYFSGKIRNDNGVKLSGVQQALLLAIGLQRKQIEDVEKELGLAMIQLLAMFVKVMRKVSMHFRQLREGAITQSMPDVQQSNGIDGDTEPNGGHVNPENVGKALEDELAEGGAEVLSEEKERMRAMIDALPLDNYEMANGDAAWEDAEKQIRDAEKKGRKHGNVAIKSSRSDDKSKRKAGEALAEAQKEAEKEMGKKHKRGR